MKPLSEAEVLRQSRGALEQWEPRWRKNAEINGAIYKKANLHHSDLLLKGTGRIVVCVGMGASLEGAVDLLAKYRKHIDIACVDKAFAPLMKRGIRPDYVIMADAMVDWDKYASDYAGQTSNIKLVANITGNPKWTKGWLGPIYFYVNKDNIHSEEIFANISGCREAIPAASNIGNIVVVFMTQILGYDRHLLVGYDYCWSMDGNYYAWQWEPVKRSFMHHIDLISRVGRWVATSNNLLFSARWLAGYLQNIARCGLDVRDCSEGIFEWRPAKLKYEMERAERLGYPRKWTDEEKKEYVACRRTGLTLTVNDFDKIPKLLGDPNVTTINVSVVGVAKADLAYAEAQ